MNFVNITPAQNSLLTNWGRWFLSELTSYVIAQNGRFSVTFIVGNYKNTYYFQKEIELMSFLWIHLADFHVPIKQSDISYVISDSVFESNHTCTIYASGKFTRLVNPIKYDKLGRSLPRPKSLIEYDQFGKKLDNPYYL